MLANEKQNGMHIRETLISLAIAAVLLLAAFISGGMLSKRLSSPESYSYQIEQLDAKRDTVIKLSASSAATSVAISMIPGDLGMPIANQLAELSKDFTIVLAAILLEKYLLTTLGFVVFGLIAPVCLMVCALATLLPRESRTRSLVYSNALKLLVVGVVVWGSIPASVFVTDRIEDTYEISKCATINSDDVIGDVSGAAEGTHAEASVGWGSQFVSFVSNPAGAINNVSGELISTAQAALSNYIEGLAVMIVTACVIPALTPMFALWVIRILFSRTLMTPAGLNEIISSD